MSVSILTDIGAHITVQESLVPQSISGSSDVNGGIAINRELNPDDLNLSGVLTGLLGATGGSPTGTSVAFRLQDSTNGTSGWADVSPAVSVTVAAASTSGSVNFNAKPMRQYLRAVATPTFTGGSSPTVIAAAVITLGGDARLPAT